MRRESRKLDGGSPYGRKRLLPHVAGGEIGAEIVAVGHGGQEVHKPCQIDLAVACEGVSDDGAIYSAIGESDVGERCQHTAIAGVELEGSGFIIVEQHMVGIGTGIVVADVGLGRIQAADINQNRGAGGNIYLHTPHAFQQSAGDAEDVHGWIGACEEQSAVLVGGGAIGW